MSRTSGVVAALGTRRFSENVLRNAIPDIASLLPKTVTVAVSADFARYVLAMTEQWPSDAEAVAWPTVEEAHWPFPDRPALFVWQETITFEFIITSAGDDHHQVAPFEDQRDVISLFVMPSTLIRQPPLITPKGAMIPAIDTAAWGKAVHVHPDTSASEAWWPWGHGMGRPSDHHRIAQVSRFERALVEAVGHRLASLSDPSGLRRHERRAVARTQSPYRVLDLRTPNRATASSIPQDVNWTHRWAVRGHWRNQAHGPNWELRRLTWIDPFVKGPADKPLDIRPNLFRLRHAPEERS